MSQTLTEHIQRSIDELEGRPVFVKDPFPVGLMQRAMDLTHSARNSDRAVDPKLVVKALSRLLDHDPLEDGGFDNDVPKISNSDEEAIRALANGREITSKDLQSASPVHNLLSRLQDFATLWWPKGDEQAVPEIRLGVLPANDQPDELRQFLETAWRLTAGTGWKPRYSADEYLSEDFAEKRIQEDRRQAEERHFFMPEELVQQWTAISMLDHSYATNHYGPFALSASLPDCSLKASLTSLAQGLKTNVRAIYNNASTLRSLKYSDESNGPNVSRRIEVLMKNYSTRDTPEADLMLRITEDEVDIVKGYNGTEARTNAATRAAAALTWTLFRLQGIDWVGQLDPVQTMTVAQYLADAVCDQSNLSMDGASEVLNDDEALQSLQLSPRDVEDLTYLGDSAWRQLEDEVDDMWDQVWPDNFTKEGRLGREGILSKGSPYLDKIMDELWQAGLVIRQQTALTEEAIEQSRLAQGGVGGYGSGSDGGYDESSEDEDDVLSSAGSGMWDLPDSSQTRVFTAMRGLNQALQDYRELLGKYSRQHSGE